ncbi:hypothetical protein SCHPADRAFT_945979 [Schizopora paradoxa]|uniref:F-box domain-containing protein n=1 Tax=Schizopora paradoxa TaxID=27342 RepID=A0A0H2R5F6_9AGAM|nr:hypothetical protein SCHPADRAFT_945979 [Schizopora paradoxa]
MGHIRRGVRKVRKTGKKVLEKPPVKKAIRWVIFFPIYIPLLLTQRWFERRSEDMWLSRDELSYDFRRHHHFIDMPSGVLFNPEFLPVWVARSFKPRVPKSEPRPQTSKAATLPGDILEEIFRELGVVKSDEWLFRGQREIYEYDDESKIRIQDDYPVSWMTESLRQGPLCRATFVCKHWYDVGVHLLYEHVNIRGAYDLYVFGRTVRENSRFAGLVKTFTHYQGEHHTSYVPNIKDLRVHLPESTKWNITVYAGGEHDANLTLYRKMKNLEELRVMGTVFAYWNTRFKYPSVRALTMEGYYDLYTGLPFNPVIKDSFPNVELFRFFSGKILLYSYHRGFPMDTSHMHMPHLRELEVIDVDMVERGVDLLQGMLETNAATLEKLVVVGNTVGSQSETVTSVALRQFLPCLNMDVCPHLKDVTLGYQSIEVPFQDVIPGLVFPTAIERLEIRGSVFPWPEEGRGSTRLQIFYDADGAFRANGRQHFTKMPNLKEIVVYGKPSEVFEKYHPTLYDACVDDDVSLKLYRVDRECDCCTPKGVACNDWMHYNTPDGKVLLPERRREREACEEAYMREWLGLGPAE